jgi:20S proteasome subunit beta 2
VCEAIESGIFNDLGSGSNVDVTVIERDHTEVLRNYKRPNEKPQRGQNYMLKRGTTGNQTELLRFAMNLTALFLYSCPEIRR